MNRIDTAFAALRKRNECAFIPFLTAGDPDLGATAELIRVVEDNGADIVELGVPFSDPTSDGPAIQKSAEIALAAGSSLPRALEMVAQLRVSSALPVVLYGYYNPIFHYGVERFAADAASAGIDAVLVVDLPPEEAPELLPSLRANGMHFISLLAPTSDAGRITKVLRQASGFLYYVSVTGVTGAGTFRPESIEPAIVALRQRTDVPVGVGFGISNPQQAEAVAAFADAVVVGTAITRVIDAHRGTAGLMAEVGSFVRKMKDGVIAGRHSVA